MGQSPELLVYKTFVVVVVVFNIIMVHSSIVNVFNIVWLALKIENEEY